ncbi:MAG: alpha/beta fold hydrolase [Ktedonobacteraceae bacterium]
MPGRENRFREPAFNQLEPLLANLSQALQPYMTIPFAFFGYSLGALLSFELARLLRRNTNNTNNTNNTSNIMAGPEHLFVAAHRAVQLDSRSETIHALPGVEFIRALRRLGGTPEAVLQNQELMEAMSPMLRADFQVYEQYQYKPGEPLACPITAFGGTLDHTISEPELAAWSAQTSSTFRLYILPGDHFFLHSHQDLLTHMVAQNLHALLFKSS